MKNGLEASGVLSIALLLAGLVSTGVLISGLAGHPSSAAIWAHSQISQTCGESRECSSYLFGAWALISALSATGAIIWLLLVFRHGDQRSSK